MIRRSAPFSSKKMGIKRISIYKLYLLLVIRLIYGGSFTDVTLAQTYAGDEKAVCQTMEIFPLVSQHVHGSTIVELPNGDLLAAWFQGSGERWADDVAIMGARLRAGEENWSMTFVVE